MNAINTIREILATDDARVFTAPIPGYASVYVLAETEQKARDAEIERERTARKTVQIGAEIEKIGRAA